jgi:tetratricopeptide (TPR) repeat protein
MGLGPSQHEEITQRVLPFLRPAILDQIVYGNNDQDNPSDYFNPEWYFDKAIGIDPNYAIAINGKGNALSDLGQYEEAIEMYDRAIEIDPNDIGAINGKGNALSDLRRYDEAIELYDKAPFT